MASDWTTIDLAVTEGYVNYIATATDPLAHGAGEVSGDASLYRVFSLGDDREPLRAEFQMSLVILGRSVSEARRAADEDDSPWSGWQNEITDDVIGILFKADETEWRRGYLYLHPDQFDKLVGKLTIGMKIRLHSRQSAQSKCDLIERVDVTTKLAKPCAGNDQ